MTTTTFNVGIAYAEYKHRRAAFILAAIVAFTMSSYFVVGYLAGDLLFWVWDIAQGMNGAVGIGICAVMTAYQFILYSQGDMKGGRKATLLAVCVAVGFSLLSEVGQGMERDHVRMESKSQQSPTYQAIVGKITNTTGPAAHPYSIDLKQAEMKLARCQQKVADGLWSDCIESTARLNSVRGMITDHYNQNQQHSITLANTAKQMEKDESNYHPLVNLIKSTIDSSGILASFLLSLLLISFFEYAFHYLGRKLADKRSELLTNGYDVTRKTRKIPKALANILRQNATGTPQNADQNANNTNTPKPSTDKRSEASQNTPERTGTAMDVLNAAMTDPKEFAILHRFVIKPVFSHAFLDVAMGKIGCSQNAIKSKHKIGGDFTAWIMMLLDVADVVSEPTKTGTRTLIKKLDQDEALEALAAVLTVVVGAEEAAPIIDEVTRSYLLQSQKADEEKARLLSAHRVA